MVISGVVSRVAIVMTHHISNVMKNITITFCKKCILSLERILLVLYPV